MHCCIQSAREAADSTSSELMLLIALTAERGDEDDNPTNNWLSILFAPLIFLVVLLSLTSLWLSMFFFSWWHNYYLGKT